MKFSKYTEQELKSLNVLPAGIYAFKVIEATNDFSKKKEGSDEPQKEIIKLKLSTKDAKGRDKYVYCTLSEEMPHIIKHFCDVAGLSFLYDQERLDAQDCIGKVGMMELIVKKSTNPQFGDQNWVKDFVLQKTTASNPELQKQADEVFKDDDITF